jgi:hypothetical protein
MFTLTSIEFLISFPPQQQQPGAFAVLFKPCDENTTTDFPFISKLCNFGSSPGLFNSNRSILYTVR